MVKIFHVVVFSLFSLVQLVESPFDCIMPDKKIATHIIYISVYKIGREPRDMNNIQQVYGEGKRKI